ncbi:hypothetical protein FACS189490_13670 [Clostridia bacterium]|nr:hypothetical protein FACS189490_13670 [Clostridia bacterium]
MPPLSDLFAKSGDGVYSDKVPNWFFYSLWSVVECFLCFFFYEAKKSFFDQGGVILTNEPLRAIQFGLSAYIPIAVAILLFALSVSLIPAAALLLIVLYVFVLLGQTSFAITIGNSVCKPLNKNMPTEVYLLIGLVLLKAGGLIPYANTAVLGLFVPVLCLGVFFATLTNWSIRKLFYAVPYYETKTPSFDRKNIRNIIEGKK